MTVKHLNPSPGMLTTVAASLFLMAITFHSCRQPAVERTYHGVAVDSIEGELKALLHSWYPRIIDTVNSGYWTNFEYDWTRSDDQNKFLVTQARGLWTAARAARVYPDNPIYRQAADHGYRYLTERMWDEDGGGFRQNIPEPESPTFKMTYGNAFALYALAEYAKIKPDPAVLEWVRKTFRWLEERAHDPRYGGYYNILIDPAVRFANETDRQHFIEQQGWGLDSWKDQNTSIHVLEALTTTYQVLPEADIRQRLEEMLLLVRDTMTHPDGYLHLYFTSDWQPVVHRDSSRAFVIDNQRYDHISFGHNIETAYLLYDAASVLYGKVDDTTLGVAKKLIDHTIEFGFAPDFYGLYDRGYQFAPEDPIEILNRQKTWWAEAEAWHALGLFADLYPREDIYAEGFRKMWTYLQAELIDHDHGGWYANGLDEDPQSRTGRKAHAWKGAYHNGRALMQVREYALMHE